MTVWDVTDLHPLRDGLARQKAVWPLPNQQDWTAERARPRVYTVLERAADWRGAFTDRTP